MKLPATLYVTKDGEVVKEGDLNAAFLLGREGKEMSDAQINSYRPGLAAKVKAFIKDKPEEAEEPAEAEAETEEAAPEEQKAQPAARNKARTADENKSA